MDQSSSSDATPSLIELSRQALFQVALLGAGLGLLYWLLTLLVRQVVFVPLFCGDPTSNMCVGATGSAGVIALIITSIAGLMGLVRLAMYRPLLVALAAAVSLWGLAAWTANLYWFEAIAWSILLFALSYVLFTWLVRPRSFAFAVISILVVVILIRIIAVL